MSLNSLKKEGKMTHQIWKKYHGISIELGSRFRVNETSQTSEHYSDQMQAVMKPKSWPILDQIYLSMIEYPKHDWHAAFGHKRLCYRRATAGTFILNLLYSAFLIWNENRLVVKKMLKSVFLKNNVGNLKHLPLQYCWYFVQIKHSQIPASEWIM